MYEEINRIFGRELAWKSREFQRDYRESLLEGSQVVFSR
jgi:hypothetical protein